MLKSIFISHHFDDKGMKLAEAVSRLVASHNIKPVTGKRLEGQVLSYGVKSLMENCQGTIVLLTNREEGKNSQWVKDERAHAGGLKHNLITLLDEGLYDEGMYSNNERIRIKWNQLHTNLLDLSETINHWKYSGGNDIKLLLQPDEVSETISNLVDNYPIKYRIWRNNENVPNKSPGWNHIIARPEQGGATIFIQDVKENDLIEVEANINGNRWTSPAANPNVMVKLKKI